MCSRSTRQFRQPRKRRTTGYDLCPGCLYYNCDPMITNQSRVQKKFDKRIKQGLCPSCGNSPCECKSNVRKLICPKCKSTKVVIYNFVYPLCHCNTCNNEWH